MTPDICLVKHDPPSSYGDCVRACVASMLDKRTADVPHFAHDGPDGDTLRKRLSDWLDAAPCWIGLPGSLDEVQEFMRVVNPGVWYMLISADHAVICRNGTVQHDPAWVRVALVPPADGVWYLMVLTV